MTGSCSGCDSVAADLSMSQSAITACSAADTISIMLPTACSAAIMKTHAPSRMPHLATICPAGQKNNQRSSSISPDPGRACNFGSKDCNSGFLDNTFISAAFADSFAGVPICARL